MILMLCLRRTGMGEWRERLMPSGNLFSEETRNVKKKANIADFAEDEENYDNMIVFDADSVMGILW